jgi:hypothetical protein
MKDQGWIGVDFDKTLAYYESGTFNGPLGAPVPSMLRRVKEWLKEGKEVRIFTARVSHNGTAKRMMEASREHRKIEAWCTEHLGCIIPVTCMKDQRMNELWDDRAVQVRPNLGDTLEDELGRWKDDNKRLRKEASGLRGVLDTRPSQTHDEFPVARWPGVTR